MTSVSSSKGQKPITPSKVKITAEKNSTFRFPLISVLILMIIGIAIAAIIYGVNYNKYLTQLDKEKEGNKAVSTLTVSDVSSEGDNIILQTKGIRYEM